MSAVATSSTSADGVQTVFDNHLLNVESGRPRAASSLCLLSMKRGLFAVSAHGARRGPLCQAFLSSQSRIRLANPNALALLNP